MNSLFFRISSFSLTFISLISLFGCPDRPLFQPDLVVSQTPSQPSSSTTTVTFGSIDVTQTKTLEIAIYNKGNGTAIFKGLNIIGDFIIPSAKKDTLSTEKLTHPVCQNGMEILSKESCSVVLEFIPQAAQVRTGNLKILYEKLETNDPREKTVALSGTGNLNCSIQEDMNAQFQNGSTVGTERNQTEFNNGNAAGLALTQEEGYADGYAQNYQSSYDQSYESAYDSAYDIGYTRGLNQGLNDVGSCSSGSSDGELDGYFEGVSQGYSDGYSDGYEEGEDTAKYVGYNNGYNAGFPIGRSQGLAEGLADGEDNAYYNGYDSGYYAGDEDGYSEGYFVGSDYGYDLGYYDGSVSCKKGDQKRITKKDIEELLKKAGKSEGASPTLFLTACYNAGFDHTYNSQSFNNGYAQGQLNNTNYQTGLSEGTSAGTNAGNTDGTRAGQIAGDERGQADGIIVGKETIYEECYVNAFESAYVVAYYDGYTDGDDDGYSDGYYDHYESSYNTGYNDGFDVGFDTAYNEGYIIGNSSSTDFENGYDVGYVDGYNSGYDEGYDYGFDVSYSSGYDDGYYDYCYVSEKALADKGKKKVLPVTAKFHTLKLTKESLNKKIQASLAKVKRDPVTGLPKEPVKPIPADYKNNIDKLNRKLLAGGGEVTLRNNQTARVHVFKQISIPESNLVRTIKLPHKKLPASIGKFNSGESRRALEELRTLESPSSLRSILQSQISTQRSITPLKLQKEEIPVQTPQQKRAAAKKKVAEQNKE